MNKVRLHIPVGTDEQIYIRDEVCASLSIAYEAVIVKYSEITKITEDGLIFIPVSIVEVYSSHVDLEYFKILADVVSRQIGDSVILEVIQETVYIGTANKGGE